VLLSGRQTQPYRRGPRMPGQALTNMLRGRSATGFNPADITRAAFLVKAGKGKRKRPARPPRPARPAR
jgi:hypothetical protein